MGLVGVIIAVVAIYFIAKLSFKIMKALLILAVLGGLAWLLFVR